MSSRLVLVWFFIILMGLAFAGSMYFSAAQSGTNVIGIINQNTTWNKIDNPYTLTGPVAVNTGVTLTIEPGVTVNLDNYYIQVNGTLVAKGTNTNKIYFNGNNNTAGIVFTNVSTVWNEKTASGCIIQNAVLSSTGLSIANSPKLNNNSMSGISISNGSPIVSNNTIIDVEVTDGSPSILNNNITNVDFGSFYIAGGSPQIYYNNVAGGIEERGYNVGEPVISYNTIRGGIDVDSRGGPVTISNNTITGNGFQVIKMIGVSSTITNNTIMGVDATFGINALGANTLISDNLIAGCTTGISSGNAVIQNNAIYGNSGTGIVAGQGNETIEENLIFNNGGSGISVSAGATCTIQNNTIANNSAGIHVSSSSVVLKYNNIQNNTQNSLYLSGVPQNLDATNNWWGTTDAAAINQSIYDFKNDFNLGNVTFVPFLASPNLYAPATPASSPSSTPIASPTLTPTLSPTPTASASPSPTSTPTASSSPPIPEFPAWVILPFLIAATIAAFAYAKKKKAKTTKQSLIRFCTSSQLQNSSTPNANPDA